MSATGKGSRSEGNRNGWQIFRWPLLLAAITAVGLGAALVGDGWLDALSWLALGAIVAVMAIAWCGAGRHGGQPR